MPANQRLKLTGVAILLSRASSVLQAARQLSPSVRRLVFSFCEVTMPIPQPIANQQTVGNIGLFYVCYRLSRMGWNVMPTARNAKGIDILIYSQDASQTRTV